MDTSDQRFYEPLPTLLLISRSEEVAVFFRHKLFHLYHVYVESSNHVQTLPLSHIKIDSIFLDDAEFMGDIFAFCSIIRRVEGLEFVPICVISENLQLTYAKKLRRAGVFDLLYLPLDTDNLLEKIARGQYLSNKHIDINRIASPLSFDFSAPSLNNRSIFDQSHIAQLREIISSQQNLSALMIETSTPLSKKTYRSMQIFISDTIRPPDICIPLHDGKRFLILLNKKEARAIAYAKKLQKRGLAKKHMYFSMGIAAQNPTHQIFFASLEDLIYTAGVSLEKAQKLGNGIIAYLHDNPLTS